MFAKLHVVTKLLIFRLCLKAVLITRVVYTVTIKRRNLDYRPNGASMPN